MKESGVKRVRGTVRGKASDKDAVSGKKGKKTKGVRDTKGQPTKKI